MVDDPLKKLLFDEMSKPYHDPEVAKQRLLPSNKIVYLAWKSSKIIPMEIKWREMIATGVDQSPFTGPSRELSQAEQSEVVSVTSPIADIVSIINPFQLIPSKVSKDLIYWSENRVKLVETDRKYMLRGKWQTNLVGPLEGQPYEKEVKINEYYMSRNFYTITENSQTIPWPLLEDRHPLAVYDAVRKMYVDLLKWPKAGDATYIPAEGEKYDYAQAFLASAIQSVMAINQVPDLSWYRGRTFGQYNPINWNPLEKSISSVLANIAWGDWILDGGLSPEWNDMSEEAINDYNIVLAHFIDELDNWIGENIGELWLRDHDGWSFDPSWERILGRFLIEGIIHETTVVENQGVIKSLISAILGMNFSMIEDHSSHQWFKATKGRKQNFELVRSFVNTNIMGWVFAIQFPDEVRDYISEWLYDHGDS